MARRRRHTHAEATEEESKGILLGTRLSRQESRSGTERKERVVVWLCETA